MHIRLDSKPGVLGSAEAELSAGESNSLCHGLCHFAELLHEQTCYITQKRKGKTPQNLI